MSRLRPRGAWSRALGAVGLMLASAGCADGAGSSDACVGCGALDAARSDGAESDASAPGDADLHSDGGGLDARADDAALDGGAAPDAAPTGPDYLTRLASPLDFASLSAGGSVKYLLRVTGATPRAPLLESCYFQNTARFPFHIQFLRAFAELASLSNQDYQVLVLRPATRIWWGGGVIRVARPHPLSGEPESLAYQIYAENGAAVGLREADVVEVDALLRGCMPYADRLLAFLPGDPFQEQLARGFADRLAQRGIAVLLP